MLHLIHAVNSVAYVVGLTRRDRQKKRSLREPRPQRIEHVMRHPGFQALMAQDAPGLAHMPLAQFCPHKAPKAVYTSIILLDDSVQILALSHDNGGAVRRVVTTDYSPEVFYLQVIAGEFGLGVA